MAVTIKSAREIAEMRAAGLIVAEVLALMRESVRPGITTGELDRLAQDLISRRGGTPSFLGYGGFPAGICASVNEEIVHGIPGARRLKTGDIISIDVGVYLRGYHADAAITLPVGEVSPEAEALIRVTEEAFQAGIAEAVAGKRIGDIGAAIREYAESRGYGVVRELTGHGIGRELHEAPNVPNFGRPGTGMRLRAGMTLAIEPMLVTGSPETRTLADDWTVVTVDSGLASHYEHTVLITEEKAVLLTAPDTDVI